MAISRGLRTTQASFQSKLTEGMTTVLLIGIKDKGYDVHLKSV